MSDDRAFRPVVAEGLVRRFGKIEAVAGIDLSIDAGEIFGFLGPNGAGKSTTVRMLTTLLKPTARSSPATTSSPMPMPCVALSEWRCRTRPSIHS